MTSVTDELPAAAEVTSTARVLVASLRAYGVDRLFCVPGESFLSLLDALYDAADIDVVTCRHEASAAFMAVADAKLTGRAGVCVVHRAPGATNAAIAVHAAAQDATPLVLLVGHVPRAKLGTDAFQDIDCVRLFSGFAKGVWVLHDPEQTEVGIARAFRIAASGTPGPTVVVLPEDVLAAARAATEPRAWRDERVGIPTEAVESCMDLLARAKRPLAVAGERLSLAPARAALAAFAERHAVPVVTSNKQQHLLPNRHSCYAGHLHNTTSERQRAAFARADLVLAVGTLLDDVTTHGGRFPRAPVPDQPLVHAYPDAARLGAAHQPTLGLECDPAELLTRLALEPRTETRARRAWCRSLHDLELEHAHFRWPAPADGVAVGDVVRTLSRLTLGNATVVVDSGTFTSWVYRYYRFGSAGTLLGLASSPMGFGVPAAVAAALRAPAEPVIAIVGDGGFVMNAGELTTAVARSLPLVVIVSNNGSYGTIRMHQEHAYPGRVFATDLVNPDFARLADAHGARGERVRSAGDLDAVLRRALVEPRPVVVDVRTSLACITPSRRIAVNGGIRRADEVGRARA